MQSKKRRARSKMARYKEWVSSYEWFDEEARAWNAGDDYFGRYHVGKEVRKSIRTMARDQGKVGVPKLAGKDRRREQILLSETGQLPSRNSILGRFHKAGGKGEMYVAPSVTGW